MRQKVRRIVIYLALLAFPVTLNYFSPYVSVTGAFMGIIAGSVLMFALQFISGLFFGRVWCSWLCPMAGLSEIGMTVNSRNVPARRLKVIRYSIFGVWFAVLLAGFILAGGIRGVDPLLMTENVISSEFTFFRK